MSPYWRQNLARSCSAPPCWVAWARLLDAGPRSASQEKQKLSQKSLSFPGDMGGSPRPGICSTAWALTLQQARGPGALPALPGPTAAWH